MRIWIEYIFNIILARCPHMIKDILWHFGVLCIQYMLASQYREPCWRIEEQKNISKIKNMIQVVENPSSWMEHSNLT